LKKKIKCLLRKYNSINFVKSVFLISGGTIFGQILTILSKPVISRLYTPEEYGVLSVYAALLGMLAIAGSLKYEWGIAIADDDEEAVNVISLSIIVLVIFSVVITLLVLFLGDWFFNLFDSQTISKYRFLIPVGIFFICIYHVFNQWALRKKQFKDVAKTKISQSIMRNAVIIGSGLLGFGPVGLIIGQIIGQSAGVTTLARPFFKNHSYLLKKININRVIWSAKRYKKFPLFGTPGQILNSAGIQLPVLFIASLYGPESIGFYGLANGIVRIPMTLIGKSVNDVFFAEAAKIGKKDPQRIKKLSIKVTKNLILLGIPPLLVLLIFAPNLFTFVFGDNWYEAGIYAQIISFLVYAKFIFTPTSMVYTVFEQQGKEFVLNIIRVVLVLIAFGFAKWFTLSSYCAITLYVLAMSIVYLITFIGAQRILDREIERTKANV